MTSKNKKLLIRLGVAIVLWVIAIILQFTLKESLVNEIIYASIYGASFLVAGYDVVIGAIRNLINGNLLDELFLMSIAAIGAFCMRIFGEAEYLEAVAIMVFFQIGEVFQGVAVEKSRGAIMSSMSLRANSCLLSDGSEVDVDLVEVGSIIVIRPGEMIPIDGVIIGNGVINTASLTGEPLDINLEDGQVVLSGSINTSSPIKIKTSKAYKDSTAAKILDMVENATMRKAKSEKLITKFAHIYTPIVVALALVIAIIPPVIIGIIDGFSLSIFKDYIYAALTCLVVSCPCALVVSVPLTYFAGIGSNAKRKIIVKGGSYLEDLARVKVVVTDKTGTITKASFGIVDVVGSNKEEILKIAKGLEINSTHPLAKAVIKENIDYYSFEIEEKPGFGVIGYMDGIKYICGSKKMLIDEKIEPICIEEYGSVLYVCKDNYCLGAIILEDEIKEEAKEIIDSLHNMGKRIILLSGDTEATVLKVCNKLGIKEYYSSLLPEDKVKMVEKIKDESDGKVLFIGDGINDAPVLALADIGVSMGQIGSDAAVEASDVVILNDDLKAIAKTLAIAKKTRKIVLENIIFTIGIKVLVLLLCAISSLPFINFTVPIGVAIFADVGVCVIAVFNAMRALRIKTK